MPGKYGISIDKDILCVFVYSFTHPSESLDSADGNIFSLITPKRAKMIFGLQLTGNAASTAALDLVICHAGVSEFHL